MTLAGHDVTKIKIQSIAVGTGPVLSNPTSLKGEPRETPGAKPTRLGIRIETYWDDVAELAALRTKRYLSNLPLRRLMEIMK